MQSFAGEKFMIIFFFLPAYLHFESYKAKAGLGETGF
jgi:hypothetical protein